MSAPEHPPPWRWTCVEDFVVQNGPLAGQRAWTAIDLVDAEDRPVATVTNSDVMNFDAAGIRELLAAAPELESLLRRLEYANDGHCPLCGTGLTDHSKCDLGALLARLDAARKAAHSG